ncbi:hypothetical protein ALC53_08975 [Atta colombica]|uniref:DDE Tnp4 domain-containing protein n=1 Tax=Atta colombica TaxID=520822 RepID=A0A151I206_9HYME|nr:hypothetical protein ALC53_08975 [Atta colombica]
MENIALLILQSGSMFYNYKREYCVVLLALINAYLQFIYVDVGTNGRVSDSGVWNKCSLKNHLDRGTLNIFPPAPLPDTQDNFPLYQNMVGDWLADAVTTDAEFGMSSDEMYDFDSIEELALFDPSAFALNLFDNIVLLLCPNKGHCLIIYIIMHSMIFSCKKIIFWSYCVMSYSQTILIEYLEKNHIYSLRRVRNDEIMISSRTQYDYVLDFVDPSELHGAQDVEYITVAEKEDKDSFEPEEYIIDDEDGKVDFRYKRKTVQFWMKKKFVEI